MRLSCEWLKTFGIACDADDLAARYTMAGLEVDEVIAAAPEFSQIVIGHVQDLVAHPDADKLRIATVDVGQGEPLQIVCGAPNVAKGVKVPAALIGAVLPGDLWIKKSKLRGVESFGMLCSARELGISDDHAGLMLLPEDAPIGQDIRDYLGLDDRILDIDLTPNRADAFSMRGLAREAGVLLQQDVDLSLPDAVDASQAATIQVRNQATEVCPRYFAREICGIDITRPTPIWLAERLRRAGVRPHDPVVDVTNYVMMCLGTPMHAFDADKVHGALTVRFARQGERLRLLNEQTADLSSDVLLIADDAQALAIAGVMGGAESACSKETANIILESAWFDPVCIAGKARRFGLSSDSAQRFERGVDFTLQEAAMAMATRLITDICGGVVHEVVYCEERAHLPERKIIDLRRDAVKKRIGRSYDDQRIADIFTRLGCRVETSSAGWKVSAPSWRFDLAIEEDLIEEIVRIDGYEQVEAVLPMVDYRGDRACDALSVYVDKLVYVGFNEVITYSFIDRESHQVFFHDADVITLHNPISLALSEMRLSLVPSLVNAVAYNRNRQQYDLRLFEVGKVFIPQGGRAVDCTQEMRIAGVMCGRAYPEQWAQSSRLVDFYDIKGIVEQLLGSSAEYRMSERAYLHPGQSADIYCEGQYIGYVGRLHPAVQQDLSMKGQPVWVFELAADILAAEATPQFQKIAKYPAVRRDLALVLDKSVPAADIERVIREQVGTFLADTFFFDLYQGEHLAADKKSLAVAIVLQSSEKTLQDEEVERIIAELFQKLQESFKAELR